MLLSADSLTIIFVKIYCYWTRTVGVIAKGSRGPFFFETQCRNASQYTKPHSAMPPKKRDLTVSHSAPRF